MPDPDDLQLLEDTVRAAGHIARDFFCRDYKSWNKSGGSPVTEADLAVDKYLCEKLTAARPDYGWLSEESTDNPERLTKHNVFVVDPIDGTIAFLKGRPHFTICAAVVTEGRPCSGIVYNPITDDMYAARTGGGARCNGTRLEVSTRAVLEDCVMLGNREQLTRKPWPSMRIENRNSVAYRLALVADGTADASAALSAKRDWDLAAADVILCEAGGCLTDIRGARLVYNNPAAVHPNFIAGNRQLHAQMLELLRQ